MDQTRNNSKESLDIANGGRLTIAVPNRKSASPQEYGHNSQGIYQRSKAILSMWGRSQEKVLPAEALAPVPIYLTRSRKLQPEPYLKASRDTLLRHRKERNHLFLEPYCMIAAERGTRIIISLIWIRKMMPLFQCNATMPGLMDVVM